MEDRDFSPELVERLTNRNEYNLRGMVRNLQDLPPKPGEGFTLTPKDKNDNNKRQPLGSLDRLPPELLDMLLSLLDCLSLTRLQRVSAAAHTAVDSLSSYRQLREFVPDVLAALAQTRILYFHSVAGLHAALMSDRCTSCVSAYGGFLLLPTCERVCFDCLHKNVSLQMTTVQNARQAFGLSAKDMKDKEIPVFQSIPGSYSVLAHMHRPKSLKLVNIRQAKELALRIHGDKLADVLTASKAKVSARMFARYAKFHEAPLAPVNRPLFLDPLPTPTAQPDGDDYSGIASMRCPSLRRNDKSFVPDRGRICKGCFITRHLYQKKELPAGVLEREFPSGLDPDEPLYARTTRLYSEDEFAGHLRTCVGVERLLEYWDKGEEDPYKLDL